MMRSNPELSEYQKRIEAIDNVILCVAEAERMVKEVGASHMSDFDAIARPVADAPKKSKFSWGASRTAP